jgi:hypothetical protein
LRGLSRESETKGVGGRNKNEIVSREEKLLQRREKVAALTIRIYASKLTKREKIVMFETENEFWVLRKEEGTFEVLFLRRFQKM